MAESRRPSSANLGSPPLSPACSLNPETDDAAPVGSDASPLKPRRIKRFLWDILCSSPKHHSRTVHSKPDLDPDFKRSTPGGGALWSPQQKPSRPKISRSCLLDNAEESFKQPETRPINQDQLVTEVKGIYAGLVMVESKCIEVDNTKSSKDETRLNNGQWQALVALHRTLLHEHNAFFLDSQYWSASEAPKKPAAKYAMPASQRHQDIELRVNGSVRGVPVDALADTGADLNAVSRSVATRLGLKIRTGCQKRNIRLPNGSTCSSLGTTVLRFKFAGEKQAHKIRCNIVDNLQHGIILGYDFLQTTQTLTEYFKKRVKSVVCAKRQGVSVRLLDNAHASTHHKARMAGLIHGQRAIVVPDTGSGIMAVSSSYAKRLGVEVDRTRTREVMFADGSTTVTKGIAKATWKFLGPRLDQWEYEWHVIDNLPVDAILDVHFVMKHKVFLEHQASFVQDPQELPKSRMAEIFGIISLPGGNPELTDLASEFLTDLSYPNPFDYKMFEREVRRRRDIETNISKLNFEDQSQERLNERARSQRWDQLKELRDTGGDWTGPRDQYVREVRQLQIDKGNQKVHRPVATNQSASNSNDLDSSTVQAAHNGQGSMQKLWRQVKTKVRESI